MKTVTSFTVDLITFSSRNNTKLSRERICSLGFFVCRQLTLISEECSWSGEIRTTDRNLLLLLLLLLFFYLFLFVFLRHWTEKPIMIILLCHTLVSCWLVHFSHLITELKIYHLYALTTLTMNWTVLILVVCRIPVTYELS